MTKKITVEAEIDTGLTDRAVEHVVRNSLIGFDIDKIEVEEA